MVLAERDTEDNETEIDIDVAHKAASGHEGGGKDQSDTAAIRESATPDRPPSQPNNATRAEWHTSSRAVPPIPAGSPSRPNTGEITKVLYSRASTGGMCTAGPALEGKYGGINGFTIFLACLMSHSI